MNKKIIIIAFLGVILFVGMGFVSQTTIGGHGLVGGLNVFKIPKLFLISAPSEADLYSDVGVKYICDTSKCIPATKNLPTWYILVEACWNKDCAHASFADNTKILFTGECKTGQSIGICEWKPKGTIAGADYMEWSSKFYKEGTWLIRAYIYDNNLKYLFHEERTIVVKPPKVYSLDVVFSPPRPSEQVTYPITLINKGDTATYRLFLLFRFYMRDGGAHAPAEPITSTITILQNQQLQVEIDVNLEDYLKRNVGWQYSLSDVANVDVRLIIEESETGYRVYDSGYLITGSPTVTKKHECPSIGYKECTDQTHYRVCDDYDGDGWREWSAPATCPPNTICQNGECVILKQDECSPSGKRECVDETHYRVCGDFNNDGYLEWTTVACPSGTVCSNGQCVATKDECSPSGAKECVDNESYRVCGDYDNDGYLEWQTFNCPEGTVCENGECIAPKIIMQDECSPEGKRECIDENSYRECGDFNKDGYLEWQTFYCPPDTTCQNGDCVSALTCYGTTSSCCSDDDCPDYCVDAFTLMDGSCPVVGEECSYEQIVCEYGCENASCVPPPKAPPCEGTPESCCSHEDCPSYCEDNVTLAYGYCPSVGSACEYSFIDCSPGKCEDGECVDVEPPPIPEFCGNGVCDLGETEQNCPEDCVVVVPSPPPSPPQPPKKICNPGENRCVGNDLMVCSNDGTRWEYVKTCQYGCDPETNECKPAPYAIEPVVALTIVGVILIIIWQLGYLNPLIRKINKEIDKLLRRR